MTLGEPRRGRGLRSEEDVVGQRGALVPLEVLRSDFLEAHVLEGRGVAPGHGLLGAHHRAPAAGLWRDPPAEGLVAQQLLLLLSLLLELLVFDLFQFLSGFNLSLLFALLAHLLREQLRKKKKHKRKRAEETFRDAEAEKVGETKDGQRRKRNIERDGEGVIKKEKEKKQTRKGRRDRM